MTAMLLPAAKRVAYLPRTPWVKSYSAAISGAAVLRGLGIHGPFFAAGASCADETDSITTLDMDNHNDEFLLGLSEQDETVFQLRMSRIWNDQ